MKCKYIILVFHFILYAYVQNGTYTWSRMKLNLEVSVFSAFNFDIFHVLNILNTNLLIILILFNIICFCFKSNFKVVVCSVARVAPRTQQWLLLTFLK